MAANSSRPQALDAGISGDPLEGGLQLMGHHLRIRWPQEWKEHQRGCFSASNDSRHHLTGVHQRIAGDVRHERWQVVGDAGYGKQLSLMQPEHTLWTRRLIDYFEPLLIAPCISAR